MPSSNDLKIFQNIERVQNNSDILISQFLGPRHFKRVTSACQCALKKKHVTQLNSTQLTSTCRFQMFKNIARVKNKSDMFIIQQKWDQGIF